MKKLQLLSLAGALAFGSATHAQTNTPPADAPTPADQPTAQQAPASDQTSQPARPTTAQGADQAGAPAQPGSSTPGTTNPAPSTSQTEGTAADRSPPGATPTRQPDPGTVNPLPATKRTEGTAADPSQPGETPVRGTAAAQAPEQATSRMAAADRMQSDRRSSRMVGLGIYNQQGALLGEVKDLIIDPGSGRVTHAILATGGSTTGGSQQFSAVPWNAVKSAMQQGKVVMDEKRLRSAPSFAPGTWPDFEQREWSGEADRYWGAGGSSTRE